MFVLNTLTTLHQVQSYRQYLVYCMYYFKIRAVTFSLVFITSLVIIAISEIPKIAPGVYPTFLEYTQLFGKNYNPKQFSERENMYLSKINFIKVHNQDQQYQDTWTVNNFTDWKDQELQSKYDVPNQAINNQKNTVVQQYTKAVTNLRRLDAANLNWVTSGAVTSIKNQGSCGDCWSFASVATAESYAITQKKADKSIALSPQYPLMCTSGSNCAGGILQDATDLIAKHGCPYLSSYPYNPTSTSIAICGDTSNNFIFAQSRTVYYNMTNDADIISLLQTSPLAVTVSAGNWGSYSSGILSCPSTAVINHAVELVGYTSTYWILKNQWGASWGQGGFIWVTRSRTNVATNCFIGSTVVQFAGSISNWKTSLVYLWLLVIFLILIF